jgi:hypothetical protein
MIKLHVALAAHAVIATAVYQCMVANCYLEDQVGQCTACTLCTLFKPCRKTENVTLRVSLHKGGEGNMCMTPCMFRVNWWEFVKLGRKVRVFNVRTNACSPQKV